MRVNQPANWVLASKRTLQLAIIGLSIASMIDAGPVRAEVADEGWGDLGYSKTEAEVEAIPTSIDGSPAEPSPEAMSAAAASPVAGVNDASTDMPVSQSEGAPSSITSEDLPKDSGARPLDREASVDNEAAARSETQARVAARSSGASKPSRSFGNISTAKNTYGVMTQERQVVQYYVAPFGGMTSMFGNTTVDTNPRYAMGITGGLLLSSNFFLGASYTYADQSLSSPKSGNSIAVPDVFAYKSNYLELGGKLFFLGRESRVRPFFGGGFGWGKSYLNYTAATLQRVNYAPAYASDYVISQFDGFGELGAEVAITRAIVASAAFKLRGVLGTSTSSENSSTDAAKLAVGDSLSRSASYTVGAGLGIYF